MRVILSQDSTRLNVLRWAKQDSSFVLENHSYLKVGEATTVDIDKAHPHYFEEVEVSGQVVPGPWFLYSVAQPLYGEIADDVNPFKRTLSPGTSLYENEEKFLREAIPANKAVLQYYTQSRQSILTHDNAVYFSLVNQILAEQENST
jgi:hypothetical protein